MAAGKKRLIAAIGLASLLGLALAGCAGGPPATGGSGGDFRLLSAEADFRRLGLDGKQVAVWEDGRRSPQESSSYEWWYFDGLLDDGTVIVAWLGDNWGYGTGTRNVSLEITPPGKATRKYYKAYAEAGSYSRERAETRMGPHSFLGDLETYRIEVAPEEAGKPGIDLTLRRTVASYRPATGVVSSGRGYFAWLVAVPNGEVSGTMRLDGVSRTVHGSGYHDHNWGNVSPVDLMDNWWWGRAVVGNRTVIAAELRAGRDVGGARVPFFFVASPDKVEADSYDGESVKVTEGPMVRHPDPAHGRPIASWVSYADRGGAEAVFPISERLLTSQDFLQGQNWAVQAMAGMAGLRLWYSRFESPVTLKVPGMEKMSGGGTLEFIEFR